MNKSDVEAKQAFVENLRNRNHDKIKITKSPVDIISYYNDRKYYWEIKFTNRKDMRYFGAATLTEWEAALEFEEYFRFVIAMKYQTGWIFHEYMVEEFIQFSTIPPLKIFFNIPVGKEKSIKYPSYRIETVNLTRNRILTSIEFYKKLRDNI